MGLLESINAMIGEKHGEEIIDGCRVEDAAKAVDLSIAYSPALDCIIGTKDVEAMMYNSRLIPQPIKPKRDGLRYYTTNPAAGTWKWFTVDEMKIARARFLLLRGYLYKHVGGFPNGDQQRVIAWYFEGGVWRPDPGTPLGDLMGVVA